MSITSLVGQALGSYEIVEQIGIGGMAIVYRAYQPSMERYVAIKVMAPQFSQDAQFLTRFQREAKAIARLEHPHILPAYDYGEHAGIVYIVMRYVDAGTLKDHMAQGRLALQQVNRIVGQIGEALDYAHHMGVIHRDVKPSNILLDEQGDAYLGDFGLAWITATTLHFSSSGAMGTPSYVSPEQAKGLPVDHRSDIYSLGIMLYEMATGCVPFKAETPLGVILKHLHEPPIPPRDLTPEIPKKLEHVILKAIAKEPDARHQSAGELAEAVNLAIAEPVASTMASATRELNNTRVQEVPPISSKPERYTLTYRAAEVQQVMSWIKAGQCGGLIGLRGAGKSNFLRFILRQDVQQHYLGPNHADYAIILIDLLALSECTDWAMCELMLDRLQARLASLEIKTAAMDHVLTLHRQVMQTQDLLGARQALEQCMDILCARPAQRVVLLLDEFDTVFRTLSPFLFRFLRAIRDAHKDQVSFLVVVANDLDRLRCDLAEAEHFFRLVSRNVCDLGPYSEADARQMIHYLTSRRLIELSEQDTTRLIGLSGGHAGLIKAALSLLAGAPPAGSVDEMTAALMDEPAMQAECRKVWTSLAEDEQAALRALIGRAPADPQALRRLKRKGLVRQDQPVVIFSPLFAGLIRQQAW